MCVCECVRFLVSCETRVSPETKQVPDPYLSSLPSPIVFCPFPYGPNGYLWPSLFFLLVECKLSSLFVSRPGGSSVCRPSYPWFVTVKGPNPKVRRKVLDDGQPFSTVPPCPSRSLPLPSCLPSTSRWVSWQRVFHFRGSSGAREPCGGETEPGPFSGSPNRLRSGPISSVGAVWDPVCVEGLRRTERGPELGRGPLWTRPVVDFLLSSSKV